jgi:hypothetical protein
LIDEKTKGPKSRDRVPLITENIKQFKLKHTITHDGPVVVGPVTPAYPDVCCNAFATGQVCEETFDNVIGFATNVDNAQMCQLFCQVRETRQNAISSSIVLSCGINP